MNNDIFAGQWKAMRGALRSWWGKLTDDDFERIGGQKDKLVGVIQEKYGYTRDQAQRDVERRFNEYGDASSSGWSGSTGAAIDNMKGKAYEFGAAAASKAREATAGVASGLEQAESYLKRTEIENIVGDLAGLVRKYPVQSVLVAAGLLYLLSRGRHA
jgi:uncharacterized protein YjbJ (UPF0337 family)